MGMTQTTIRLTVNGRIHDVDAGDGALNCYARVKATGCRPPGGVEAGHGSYRHCIPNLQPWLAARPNRAQPARYRFLQAADAADDPGVLPRAAYHPFGHQTQPACAAPPDYPRKPSSVPTPSIP